ncbi:LPS export ABC transporter permease LptG [Noviluteimonas gilva]|uniref:LPS export ABC transporter permease LptG n=1 Tax=Noviluteimonas gilva TaxID=2682097 RepID=A0A7C9HLQ5_9GAMM|nr:LPS export ABC transporter permease LptG [Lysobacter gilvus]MUV13756.1 LPS export ABC transporter permease LptG [Lysobacter gilvus]
MKPFPKVHDLYIGRVVLGSVLVTWAVVTGLDLVQALLLGEIKDIGQGQYGFVEALTYVAYTAPRRAYTLFPTAAVVGSLMGLGQLAASSELTALRALGLSRRRLSGAVALALAVLTLLMVVNGETLTPWSQRKADQLKAQARSNNAILAQYAGVWAREGDVFFNALSGQQRTAKGDQWLELSHVSLYQFDDEGRLSSIAQAAIAEHRPSGWLLRNVTRTTFGATSVTQQTIPVERWKTNLDDAALAASVTRPRYLPSRDLAQSIDYFKRNGLDSGDFEEIYWGRWFYPINVLALCLAAVPFAFGSLRSGGMGKRLFIGIVFALGFWMLQTLFGNLAQAFHFDVRIAMFLPLAVMFGVSAFLFRRRSG